MIVEYNPSLTFLFIVSISAIQSFKLVLVSGTHSNDLQKESMWCYFMLFCKRVKLHTETYFSKYWCQHWHLFFFFFSHLSGLMLLTFTCRNSWKIIWSPTPKTWKAKSFIWRWRETTSVIWQRWPVTRPRMVSKSELCVSCWDTSHFGCFFFCLSINY